MVIAGLLLSFTCIRGQYYIVNILQIVQIYIIPNVVNEVGLDS